MGDRCDTGHSRELSWDDIESDRRDRGLEAGNTVCEAWWSGALAWIGRMRDSKRKAFCGAWVAYCMATHGTTKRPAGADQHRDAVLELASFGIVDPEGFDYAETARAPKKHKRAGVNRGVGGAFRSASGTWQRPY